ncbi:MAG: zinc-binding dehydrogenase, partial [Phenylobacterium sp.]|nr:zinc-binding dehydrogenase [Phenylobacterium sp.]
AMRQVNIHGPNDVRVDEVPPPVAGPRDVVVKIAACGICGTDLGFVATGGEGRRSSGRPMPLGHEASGEVMQVGADVVGVRPGQRVVVNPMSTDAVIGNGGPEGAFADLLLVREAELGRSLFEIPHGMSDAVAALVEPLAVARHAVNRAAPRPGENAVVFGAGPIGLGAVIWLKRSGVGRLVVVDLDAGRLERARALGATHTVQAGAVDLAKELARICGPAAVLGVPAVDVDLFIDAAGAPQVVGDVIAMAKLRARLVVLAVHRAPVPVDFQRMLISELNIMTSCGYPEELPQVLADLKELGDEAEILISHRFPFGEWPKAFEQARSGQCAKVMVEFS